MTVFTRSADRSSTPDRPATSVRPVLITSVRPVLIGGAVGALLLVGLAGPASAHVTVQPGEATAGGYDKITFRVPNESDTAATTGLEVTMPVDAPLRSVRAQPVPGWDVELVTTTLEEPVESAGSTITEAVTTVRWTATGEGIGVDEFEEFSLSVGPLPQEEGQLLFPAVQTYDDGEVASWVEEPADDGTEPEKPAPVLELVAAQEGDHGAHHGGSPDSSQDTDGAAADPAMATASTQAAPSAGDDGTARALGGAGLAAGIVGLGLGAAALRRSTTGSRA